MTDQLNLFLQSHYLTRAWGISAQQWLFALAVFVAVYFGTKVLIAFARKGGSGLLKRFDPSWADILGATIAGTKNLFIIVFSVWFASFSLALEPEIQSYVHHTFLLALVIQVLLWGLQIINSGFGHYIQLNGEDGSRATSLKAMSVLSRILFVSLVVLWGLDNLGVNISALMAGLGIGGVAIALATQSILGDLFASLTIVLDKPFVIGDFIVVGEFSGTIENIGLKTTRLRSLSGEQLVFSNADLLQSRIRNYRRMNERRVVFSIGVVYSTAYEHLSRISDILKEIVSSFEMARFDRAHFLSFGDSSLNYEVVYFVLSRDYNAYAELQQQINLEIYRRFLELGVDFAFPSRSLYLESMPKEFKVASQAPEAR